jgi:hypothetical protein
MQPRLSPFAVAFSADRKDRLFAYREEVTGERGEVACDFHSLVWEREAGNAWNVHLVISSDAFGNGFPLRRWVSDVHSLDAAKGTAIIQVGEEGDPVVLLLPVTKVHYSWREWDLVSNLEVARLKDCASPFDALDA